METSAPNEEGTRVNRVSSPRRAVVAAAVGQAMETYDFAIYGFMAAVLAGLFFPPGNEAAALVAALAGYAVTFVARPVGGLILGAIGDTAGRRTALSIGIVGMSIGTVLIGVLPTYAQVGLLAPALLFALRLFTGLAAGGEFGSSSSFISEFATNSNRGFLGSWQAFSTAAGVLLASIVTAGITNSMSEAALNSWGWRLVFLAAIVPGAVGIYLRFRVSDSPEFLRVKEKREVVRAPLRTAVRQQWKPMLVCFSLVLAWTVTYQSVAAFVPSFAQTAGGVDVSRSSIGNTIGLVVMLITVPLAGTLSDRVGRRPVLIGACVGFAVCAYPLFALIAQGGFVRFVVAQTSLFFLLGVISGPAPAALVELFATNVRASSLNIAYNVALVIFGGTTPLIQSFLVTLTGNDLAPSLWIVAACVITLLVILLSLRETARQPLPEVAR